VVPFYYLRLSHPASSRRAAAAAKRPARRPHATRSSNEARTAVTASASNAANRCAPAASRRVGKFSTRSPLSRIPFSRSSHIYEIHTVQPVYPEAELMDPSDLQVIRPETTMVP
jgi:hypothetical protein